MYVTVAERKARQIDRLIAASSDVMAALRTYATEHGGRFLIFGSFARGEVTRDSDLDVLVEFPPALERKARDFAEAACRRSGLKPDVCLASEASTALLTRVRRDAMGLP